MKPTFQHATLLRSLKGAPASIILALALTGVSLAKRDLEILTGYSDKPISKGLALLELNGFVQDNGRAAGWSLRAGLQLPLFPRPYSAAPLSPIQRGMEIPSRNISDFPAHSPSLLSSSTDLPDENDQGDKTEAEERLSKISDWLRLAGVGRRSPKMRQLLALDLDETYVRAWTLYSLWWQRESTRRPNHPIDGRRRFATGTLIRILLDGDQAPPDRCPDCLELEPCLCNVIHR